MSDNTGILVLAEMGADGLARIGLELLGLARGLAEASGHAVSAALLGSGLSEPAAELARGGAATVYVADAPELAEYNPDSYLFVLQGLCEQIKPAVILAGHTPLGQDLAPRLAFALTTGLTTDCTSLDWDSATGLVAVKPIYGGNAVARLSSETQPQMACVRPKVGDPLEPAEPAGDLAQIEVTLPAPATMVLGKVLEDAEGVKLEEARVVVSGGRGMGGPEGFDKLRELAGLLGGAVGASRPPCDSEWIACTSQVGITGKLVAPDIYIAVAISGSSQHLSGMSEARNIVAINKDPDAYIFKVAHYGVVGDWRQILPAFTGKLTSLLAE